MAWQASATSKVRSRASQSLGKRRAISSGPLRVRSALASGNYHKFFRLYREAPFLGPYLLDMIIERERLAAMAAICKT